MVHIYAAIITFAVQLMLCMHAAMDGYYRVSATIAIVLRGHACTDVTCGKIYKCFMPIKIYEPD